MSPTLSVSQVGFRGSNASGRRYFYQAHFGNIMLPFGAYQSLSQEQKIRKLEKAVAVHFLEIFDAAGKFFLDFPAARHARIDSEAKGDTVLQKVLFVTK